MQVSTTADAVNVADIVYLGAQQGDNDGVTAATASGTGVRIRIRTFQRPPAISHVVVGPWCTWPILSPTGDSYCASGFINVVGGEAVSGAVGAVISSEQPEQIAPIPEQDRSVTEPAPIKQNVRDDECVEAASRSSGRRPADSHLAQAECNRSVQKCTEPNKRSGAKQGNKRKHKQKQRKQKREAELKAAAAAAAAALATAAVPVSEGVAYHEQRKTDELQEDGDVTRTESSQRPEIDDEDRKTEEVMYETSCHALETDKPPGSNSDTAAIDDVTNGEELLNAKEGVLLTDKEVKASAGCHDDGVVLVMFRQFKDEDSENVDGNEGAVTCDSGEMHVESSGGTVLPVMCEAVCDSKARKRKTKTKKRGKRNKSKPACDNTKRKGDIADNVPIIICDVAQDLSHLPRERLSSCSSLSSKSDSDEGNKADARSPVKRTYYFTSRVDGDGCSSDADANVNSNGEEMAGKDDDVTNTSEDEEDEEMGKEGIAEECCQTVTMATGDRSAVADDEDPLDDSSSRCSSDTEDGHPDGQRFSTVFVVNSSTDGEDTDAEDLPVCLTNIKILSEDDLVAVTENLPVGESAELDAQASCLDTRRHGSVPLMETEVVEVGGVLLSHDCPEEEPASSEQALTTVTHESESSTETVPDCDTEVMKTVPVDGTVAPVFDNATSICESEHECMFTFMNETVPERLIKDMTAPDREEGDEQALGVEINEGQDELLSVVDSVRVQMAEEGCVPDVSAVIDESQFIDMIVPAENESDLQVINNDTEEDMNLLTHEDTDCNKCDGLQKEAIHSDCGVSENRSAHELAYSPVIPADTEAKVMTDNAVSTVEYHAAHHLSAVARNDAVDSGLARPDHNMECSEPFAHSTVEASQSSSGHHSVDKQRTSGLHHSENKEVEEVEESVFVDEAFEGEDEQGCVESESVSVTASSAARELDEDWVVGTDAAAVSGQSTGVCDDSGRPSEDAGSNEENSMCRDGGRFPNCDSTVSRGRTISTEVCPINPHATADSGVYVEETARENSPVLLSDETVAKITENFIPKVDVSEAGSREDSGGNKDNSHVLRSGDFLQQTVDPTSSVDSVIAETGDITSRHYADTCDAGYEDDNENGDIVEDTGVSVGNAACNESEQGGDVCSGEARGDTAVTVDENIVSIDNGEDLSVGNSAVEATVDDVSVAEEEEETEIRSSGDTVMLATVLQSAGSASVAGEDKLQGVSCSVVTETAKETDAYDSPSPSGEPRYTSLVMITQNHLHQESVVSVVTSETTTLVPADVIVRHTNWEEDGGDASTAGLAGYFTLTLETPGTSPSCKKPHVTKTRPQVAKKEEAAPVAQQEKDEQDLVKVVTGGDTLSAVVCLEEGLADDDSWVEELDNTGSNHEDEEFATTTPTDEDSDSGDEATLSSASAAASSSYSTDREEELRGYHRSAIDFTLHTIVEESCEESEVEHTPEENGGRKPRPTSASELEKYFFYGLGGGAAMGSPPGGGGTRELDSFSDTCSSIYSEGLESLGAEDVTAGGAGDGPAPGTDDGVTDPADLASSRLEKYFLTGFMGFPASDRNSRDSDGSGSVGSDSEGRPSPEHRRKKLVRARGTGRQQHSSSLDNLVSGELSGAEQQQSELQESEDSSSTETDTHHEDGGSSSLSITASGFEKADGQFDTVKRKKKKRSVSSSAGGRLSPASLPSLDDKKDYVSAKSPVGDTTPEKILASSEELSTLGVGHDDDSTSDDDEGSKTPQPEFLSLPATELSASRNKQQSRDSGFIGSCDDLLKEQRAGSDSSTSSNNNDSPSTAPTQKASISSGAEELKTRGTSIPCSLDSPGAPPAVEEGTGDGNRAPHTITTSSIPPATALTRKDSFNNWSSDEETNLMMSKMRVFFKTMVAASSSTQGQQKTPQASPSTRQRTTKPPQLVYFENELTRLMKTVPGIRDEQVREIVEYLSSEDTWSDSYDSSDYTSSDLEGAYYMQQQGKVGAAVVGGKSELQEQISASCQQIISKFDTSLEDDEDHDDKNCGLHRDTAFVYQRLVASFNKMAGDQQNVSGSGQKGSHSASSDSTPYSSPPLIAKVMHHIGSRLVALMHEVSGGEGLAASTSSPKVRYHHHRRLQAKLSAASTTTDDDSHTDTEQSGVELHGLPRSKSHDLLLEPGTRPNGVSSSMELATAEERETSDYERFSWRGSFESALMAADSRTKLSLLQDSNNASSTTALAAKRRSAGDLLFAGKSSSREQLLDRVRSCGSIGGSVEDRIWNARRRRSSVPDANTCHAGSGTSADGDDDDDTDDDSDMRSTTLPRSLQTSCSAGTNSLPRLPTSATPSPAPSALSTATTGGIYKAHSVQHFGQGHVKSARYRPPGFSRLAAPKRALSAPGLQPLVHPGRSNRDAGRRNRLQANTAAPSPQISGKWTLQLSVPTQSWSV
jgi:hypothetical protein